MVIFKRLLLGCILAFGLQAQGLNIITAEYPELSGFLSSSEFLRLARDCHFLVESGNDSIPTAATVYNIGIGLDGVKCEKGIIFNRAIIDRKLLTADEFKFVLCHELGHLNDPHLLNRAILPSGALALFEGCVAGQACAHLFRAEFQKLFQDIGLGVVGGVLGHLGIVKLARNGERRADRFALGITKDLAAAVSVLKRYQELNKCKIFKDDTWFNNLFSSHPHEMRRIKELTRVYREEMEGDHI